MRKFLKIPSGRRESLKELNYGRLLEEGVSKENQMVVDVGERRL